MRLRALLTLGVAVFLAACANGSGRQGTQVTVTGTGPTAAVQSGTQTQFIMTVTNTGPYDAQNVKITDNVGNQLKLVSISCAASAGAVCPASPSVVMVVPTLPDHGVLTFTVTVQLDAGASGTIQNNMSVSFSEQEDSTLGQAAVTATAFSLVTNVVVSGQAPTGTLIGGSTAVFVMTVTNNGPDATGAFNVYDNVGTGLSLISITCAASGGAVCPATISVLTPVTTLPAGGVLTFTVTTLVAQNANGTVSNGMVVDISTNPNSSANTFYATASVIAADLSVTGQAPLGPLVGGAQSAFVMTVTNKGPGTAQNIIISNVLSSALTATGAVTCAASGGASCPSPLGASMSVPSMPPQGALAFTFPFIVNAGSTGQVSDTMTVSSTTDPRGNQVATAVVGSGSSNLIVTETASSSTVNAGSNAVFIATIANIGQVVANNVAVTYALSGPAGTTATVSCTPGAAVPCPSPPYGSPVTIASIPPNRSITLTYTVPVPASAAGQSAITNVVTASAAGAGSYQASFSVTPINAGNGTYTVYAANGLQYALTIDFDALNFSLTGNGLNLVNQPFTADATGGGFTVSGTQRLRVATDLIVGGLDFGSGTTPFIAVRVFGTTVQELAGIFGGLYDFVELDLVPGAPTTAAGTMRVAGNVLDVCQVSTTIVVYTPPNCPTGSLQAYSLGVTGNVYTGLNTTVPSAQPFVFQLAIVGASAILISNNVDGSGNPQLYVALPDSPALAGGSVSGPTFSGDWATASLTTTQYTYSLQLGGTGGSTTLNQINANGGPFSLLYGNLNGTAGSTIYVMQSYPMVVEFGALGGPASGMLQLGLP